MPLFNSASKVRKNIVANFAGSVWTALMQLAFVPLYIKFLGIESYGLIGFIGTLVSLFSILDMGLSVTMTRELAMRTNQPHEAQDSRDLLRTLESIYWVVAIFIGSIIIFISFPIAKYWLNSDKLLVSDVQRAIMIMGVVTILRFPLGLYLGGLIGLQKQVLVNAIGCVVGTLRGLGAVLILWLVVPTIQAFCYWQLIVSGIETFTGAYILWVSLPEGIRRPKFKTALLKKCYSFALGMMGIVVVSMILNQADKILLSKMLTLEMFGYYMLAWSLAGSLFKLVSPVCMAVWPIFCEKVARKDHMEAAKLYHKASQLVSVVVWPVASTIGIFSYDLLRVWTSNSEIASQTHLVLSLLVVGTACHCMLDVAYSAQRAYGWTSLQFWVEIGSIIAIVPLLFWLVSVYGMIGAGLTWLALNVGYIIIEIPIMHRKILKHEMWRWYIQDVGAPFAAAVCPVFIVRILFDIPTSTTWMLVLIGATTSVSLVFTTVTASQVRHNLINLIAKSMARLNVNCARLIG